MNRPKDRYREYGILPLLSEEEMGVFRRGRNANVHNIPRNASRSDYQKATALEALFGYLYLQNKQERINELFDQMLGEEE